MKLKFMVLFLIIFGLYPAVSAAGESCFEQPVIIEHHGVYSEQLDDILKFDVYIPPCLDRRIVGGYPVVYLLHGQDMDLSIWEQARLDDVIRETLTRSDIPPFYTVLPQEDRFLLSPAISEFDEAVMEALIPWVDAHYNTCTLRSCRDIAGISRGALWAEKIAFEHPDMFEAAGLLSMPGQAFEDQALYYLVLNQTPDQRLRIRIDAGNEDDYRHEAARASSQLSYLGYLYEYNITPGGHDADYWHRMLGEYFVWFSEAWTELSRP